jgi:phage portal protein BeeE
LRDPYANRSIGTASSVTERLCGEWQRLQAGPRNSGATAILEQGLKWQALGLPMVDSQFV